jgi:hypothetical protein
MQIFVILSVVTVKCPNTTCRYTLCHGAFSVTFDLFSAGQYHGRRYEQLWVPKSQNFFATDAIKQ